MQLQLIFDEVALKAQEAKAIKAELKDSLDQVSEYVELTEEAKRINERRKALREDIRRKMGDRYAKLEELEDDLKDDKQMMSDLAMAGITEGKPQTVKDSWGNEYEPVFSVKFRRVQ
jgi:predicted nuclease with TOPRIM domain